MAADPQTLGPYRIDSRLGRGGMGVVYLATDPRLGRSVALKVLPSDSDAKSLGRFLREARTVAALRHQHIAVLHDVGEESGTSYLVMERVEGESLATLILFRDEKSPFSDEDVATLRAISPIFAVALANMVRKSQGSDGDDDGGPLLDENENPNPKAKNDADWWKRGEPPPF